MKRLLRTVLFSLLLASAGGLLTGCETDDPNMVDNKPWNTPQSWEGAMPSNMNQGR